jgi:hypothetical protein
MVVTEIHENHHYAMFAFLVPLIATRLPLRRIYFVLSATFAINLMTTKWWLETDMILQFGVLRIETMNAWANLVVLVFWIYLFLVKRKDYVTLDGIESVAEEGAI